MILSKISLLTFDLISMIKLGLANLCLGLAKWLHPILVWMNFYCWSRLQWRHNGRDGVSITSLIIVYSHLFRRRSKKTSKPRITGLCVGSSPVTGFHLMTSPWVVNVLDIRSRGNMGIIWRMPNNKCRERAIPHMNFIYIYITIALYRCMAFTFAIVYDEFTQIPQHYFSVTNKYWQNEYIQCSKELMLSPAQNKARHSHAHIPWDIF